MPLPSHILIVGSGSVGKRHARNLRTLGCDVSCMDPRADRLDELAAEGPVRGKFTTLEQALSAGGLQGVVIGSPPSVHVEQTKAALAAGLPVLLEKPVSPRLADALDLRGAAQSAKAPLLLGYTWRWWPPLDRVRTLLSEEVVGPLRHVRFVMSAHLADWHPWERYQDFFMASTAQGGGALLDESHWVDLACWMFGMPRSVLARVDRLSDLEIETDDCVDMMLEYPGRLRISLHLDLFGRPHEKSITFVGEKGSMVWSADPNRITIGSSAAGWERVEDFTCERNDMFVAVARDFLDMLSGAKPQRCTLEDGIRVLTVLEAARQSSSEGRVIRLGEAE